MKGNESVVLTASGAVKDSPGSIKAMTVTAEGATVTAAIDDSLDGSGTEKWRLNITQNRSETVVFNMPLLFAVGIYASLTGANGRLCIQFE